ncbi:hypothetical protein [Dyella caseinilytica]|uniref:Uncharacterized protein n=1 Tax=Dyella caseinilytica TaxID=1849581 RepID=A0ABX7GSI5_9GAMM|nr:hypothetical protein [Dyella caseinilytica]QRN53008.1 hypothetical protein ISN74_16425 [Dyella caseinilytica]GGA10738.1 hypothetical protein GCM10011408_35060 [Dyella caseinilytica]
MIKWKFLGFYLVYFSFACWCLLLAYAFIIGPMSVLNLGIYAWALAFIGVVLQLLIFTLERFQRLLR